MKYKKIIVLAIFLVSLLAISAVSAADNVTSDVVSMEETTVDVVKETTGEVVSVENNNQVISANESDWGTFDDLANEISAVGEGGVLNLTKDYKYVNGSNEGIQISKAITIDGKGHILDGNHLSRILYISTNNVVLANCSFVNCSSSGSGGAVRWSGSGGVLANCSFVNCSAHSDGGAVYWHGSDGVLANCSFVNCSADLSSTGWGGAVHWWNSDNGVLSNCSFVNCSQRCAGAVSWYNSDNGVLSNCSFVNCSTHSGGGGGAVIWESSDNGVLFNCSFVNCSTVYDGGAVIWEFSDNGVLFNCSFVNCSADYSGGAVSWEFSDNGVLANCSFVNCSSNGNGGGAVSWYSSDNGVLANCSFVNCSSSGSGGAVRWSGSGGVLANCSFVNCSAAGNGGAVSWYGSDGVLANCSFVNCFITVSKYGYSGGAIYWHGSDGVLEYCSFVNCSSSGSGGAVYWYDSDNGVLANCSFVNCSSNGNGGGAVSWYSSDNGVLANCSFVNCSSPTYVGGAVSWYGSGGVLANCSFVNCHGSSPLVYSGGAVYWHGSDGVLANCSFVNCSTSGKAGISGGGGAVSWYDSDNGVLSNCIFVNCSSNGNGGGAVYWHSSDNGVLANCSFVNCSSPTYVGGAVSWYGSGGVLANCSFVNCSSSGSGGAVRWSGSDNGVLANCSFVNCFASSYDAGAVYWSGSDSVLSNCSFVNCSAHSDGGAVYWDGSDGVLEYCSFVNCSAAGNGGAVCWYGNDGIINSSYFSPNLNSIYAWGNVLKIIKMYSSSLSCENISLLFKDDVNLSAHLNTIGNVIFNIFNEYNSYLFVINTTNDGYAELCNQLNTLTVGLWNVTVIFEGNDNYSPCNVTATITVLPQISSVTIDDVNATVGHEVVLVANVNSTQPINESVVTFFDGETNIGESNVIDGVATLTYTPTTAGEHTITAIFNSDNYLSSNDTALLTVSKADVDLSINYITDVYFTNPNNFAVNVNSNSKPINEGKVKYYVNKELVGTVDVYGGNANFSYVTGTAGSFTLTAAYKETDNYFAKNASATFTVNKMPTTLSGESVIFDEEAYKTFTTELKDNNNKGVGGQPVKIELIKYSGESATFNGISDANGITIYDVGRLAGGMWYVSGIYAGNDNYIDSRFVDKFIVVKMNTTTEIEEIDNPKVNHNYKLKANIHDENGKLVKEGIVQFYLDGVDIGSIDLSKNQGHQDALGEGVLGAVNPMFEFAVGADDVSDLYINYVPTKAGKHKLTAVYEGTTIYKASNSTTSFDVSNSNKKGVTITAPTVDAVYNGGKYLVITLKDAVSGKAISSAKVKVVLNGKTSTPTTNKNGQVKVSANGLAPKNYTAKITFAGNTKYDKLSDSTKIIVTKATPKITAKAKTFKKADKTKKYTVTLKNNRKLIKGVTVKITVNKKTYSAKTSSKGVATFKLTKLTKKGKFTATVKSVANKYYNAKTLKNVKITVK